MKTLARRAYYAIYDESLEDALRYASENNWNAIVPDLGVPRFSPHRYTNTMRRRLRRLSADLSVAWGFHAPSTDTNLFSYHPTISQAVLGVLRGCIDFAKDLSPEATTMVVHAGGHPTFKKAREREDAFTIQHEGLLKETLSKHLTELIDYAVPDVAVAIENHEWTPLIRGVVQELIPQGLSLCFDIPKLYNGDGSLKTDDLKLFEANADAITVVHIHDWLPDLGSHQVVGEGKIDFFRDLGVLGKLKRDPLCVFEVRPREAAQESLKNFLALLARPGV